MSDAIWIVVIGAVAGLIAGILPASLAWLINRRRGKVDDDTDLWKLYQSVKADVVRLERDVKRLSGNLDALLSAVRAESYEIARRIITRANIKD